MKSHNTVVSLLLLMGVSVAFADDPLIYKTTNYKVWTYNPNYRTSECFVPSFTVPECDLNYVEKTEDHGCDYKRGGQLRKYAEDHCVKGRPEILIKYYFSNNRLVGVGGDFGEFVIKKDADGYASGKMQGSPRLASRTYSLELGSQNINEGWIRSHKRLEFKVLEYSTNCDIEYYKNDKELCTGAAIAEYQVQ